MATSYRTREDADALATPRELERGREYFRLQAWSDAYRALSDADRLAPLAPTDLELLATAAYLVGRDAEYLRALEQAHRAYLDSGACLRAARCAYWLGLRLRLRGELGQATGWFGRAQRLLAREACESVEHGYLLLSIVERRLDAREREEAYTAAESAAEIGERFADADLVAIARHYQGRTRLDQQRLAEGLALLDEAMVFVVAGRLSPVVTGHLYCSVVRSCQRVYALGRAGEWTAALAAWCDAQPDMVAFSGMCRVHRAEVLQLRGAWTDAVQETQRACERANDRQASAAAFYQLGEMHRVKGELALAERAYLGASERGREPQPGLALLRLAQGQPNAAAAAIRGVLGVSPEHWQRLRLLPACVEIFLAAGDTEEARAACCELEELARDFDTEGLRALAAQARGAFELVAGSPEVGLVSLRRAAELWQGLGASYPVALVRAQMGLAHRALGNDEASRLELHAARATFVELGATSELRRIDSLDRPSLAARTHDLSARELEVLRLVATGMTNKAIAGKLFVSERTVHRHVSNIFVKLNVSSRAGATAYAYQHELFP